ncbi:SRPBCC family protein [soil metagenome]
MAVVRHTIPCSRTEVFEALVDPGTYPLWLVGAREIRSVDADWPAVGSAFYHRIGLVGPLKVSDLTKVVEIEEPHRLSLEVRARPLGRGRATFVLTERSGPAGPQTVAEVTEGPIGPVAPIEPLVGPLTARRNRRSLANLADHLQRGPSHRAPG